jgi:predicted HTH transcriptional regulator
VCDALALNEDERAAILGQEGEKAVAKIQGIRFTPHLDAGLNERQAKVMVYAREHSKIGLSTYRQLCPGLSDETLRRDLADLVARGLLTKNGAKRGTYYTPTA